MPVVFTRRGSNETSTTQWSSRTRVLEWDAYPAATGDEVEQSPNRPVLLNDPHPDNPGLNLRARTIAVSRVNNSGLFRYRVVFEDPTQSQDGGVQQDPDNPLSAPLRFEWGTATNAEPIDRDTNGNAIVNSAGVAFDQPPQRDYTSDILTITRNVASFDYPRAKAFRDTVNSGEWRGALPQEARCLSILPTTIYTESSSYVEERATFEIRKIDTWGEKPHQLRILDQGTYAYVSTDSGTRKVKLYDASGGELTEDVRLNGNGIPLEDGFTIKDDDDPSFVRGSVPRGATLETTPDAVYLRYDRYPARDFNSLGI
jgi:hypothetical protein